MSDKLNCPNCDSDAIEQLRDTLGDVKFICENCGSKFDYIEEKVGKNLMASTDLLDLAQWPEFVAFMDRLGIELTQPIRSLKINMSVDGETVIEQEFFGEDRADAETQREIRRRSMKISNLRDK